MKIIRLIERLILFLLENLPILGSISFSLFLVLKSQSLQLTTNQLLLWIISLLGLLAISMLLEKVIQLRKIANYSKSTHDYLVNNHSQPSFDLLFKKRRSQPSVEQRLDNARVINITGGSLTRITNEYIGYFEAKAKDNNKLRFLIVNPESEAAKLLVRNVVYEVTDEETYLRQVRTSLACLLKLRDAYPTEVEVKITNQVPPFGLIITDPDKDNGSITVEIFGYALPARERASLLLFRNREPETFNYFKCQFDQIWQHSSEV